MQYSLNPAYDRDRQPIRGKWRVKVSMGPPDYRQRSKTIRADSKKRAKDLAEDWAAQIRGADDQGSFGALCEAWYTDKLVRNKPSTMRSYRTKLDTHILPVLGAVPLLDLDRATLAAWSRSIEVTKTVDGDEVKVPAAARTRNQCIGIIRAAVRWGWEQGRVSDVSPLVALKGSLVDAPDRQPAERADVDALLKYLYANDRAVYLVVWTAMMTGLRRGEVLAFKADDVDIEAMTLRVDEAIDRQVGPLPPKTKKGRRTIAIDVLTTEFLRRQLDEHLANMRRYTGIDVRELPPDHWVFPSPRNPSQHWSPDGVTKAVTRACVRAGLDTGDVTMHRLRHFSATELADAGIADRANADRHGHESVTMTHGYMGKLKQSDRRMAEIMGEIGLSFLAELDPA